MVAHARERAHGLGRQSVQEVGGVAERLGERPARGEVQVAAVSFATSRYISAMWRSSSSGSTLPRAGYSVCLLHAGRVAG